MLADNFTEKIRPLIAAFPVTSNLTDVEKFVDVIHTTFALPLDVRLELGRAARSADERFDPVARNDGLVVVLARYDAALAASERAAA